MAAISNDAMASVMALSCKAALLVRDGHFARAAEKFAAAVVAAQSMQLPDCLIVVYLQSDEACMRFAHAKSLDTPVANAATAYESIYCVLLPSMMATLQRRKAAGTLLPGACHAHEATFFSEVQQHRLVIRDQPPMEPAFLEDLASMFGYATYVGVADIAASWLVLPLFFDMRTTPFPTLPHSQLAAHLAFILDGLELAMQPRALSTAVLTGEASFVDKCRRLVSASALINALPSSWAQQLRDALQRVERSGAMQQHFMEEDWLRAIGSRLLHKLPPLPPALLAGCATARCPPAARARRTCRTTSCAPRARPSCTAPRRTRRRIGRRTSAHAKQRARPPLPLLPLLLRPAAQAARKAAKTWRRAWSGVRTAWDRWRAAHHDDMPMLAKL
jgi:hypothetical protein